jgi:hypothetical protein
MKGEAKQVMLGFDNAKHKVTILSESYATPKQLLSGLQNIIWVIYNSNINNTYVNCHPSYKYPLNKWHGLSLPCAFVCELKHLLFFDLTRYLSW